MQLVSVEVVGTLGGRLNISLATLFKTDNLLQYDIRERNE